MKMRLTFAACVLGFASHVSAFDEDGFRSGMSRIDLERVAALRGDEVWENTHGNYIMGRRFEQRLDGTFVFCEDKLVIYSHSIDFDTDYIATLQTMLARHGQGRTSVRKGPWPGTGGGLIYGADMTWLFDGEEITLGFVPEGRDGKGNLRYTRSAHLAYHAKNKCSPR